MKVSVDRFSQNLFICMSMWSRVLRDFFIEHLQSLHHKMDVGNGLLTSFWYDSWSPLGCLLDITGRRGVIDMGISLDCTVATVFQTHRRRHSPSGYSQQNWSWDKKNRARSRRVKRWMFHFGDLKGDKFKNTFITKETYNMVRQEDEQLEWAKDIWF